jgi:phosphoserine phosphatase RsbX
MGDVHVVTPFEGGVVLAVIDGLGHGREAAAAARLAAQTLNAEPDRSPAEHIARCHTALRGTRGAAMLVVSVSYRSATASWAGVGNVEGWRLTGSQREAMISRAGVVGYQITTPTERTALLRPDDLLVLASDGISTGFCETLTPAADIDGLASEILSGYARSNDDALVLVARCGAGEVG